MHFLILQFNNFEALYNLYEYLVIWNKFNEIFILPSISIKIFSGITFLSSRSTKILILLFIKDFTIHYFLSLF